MNDRAISTLLGLLPKAALSRAVGSASRSKLPAPIHRAAARAFSFGFDVDLSEAELPLSGYATFSEFFTRRLKEGARPVAPGEPVVVSPVDGRVAGLGWAAGGRLLQAKGRDYSLAALLDDPLEAREFEGGIYLTIYLSPRDYHRIHAPLQGQVEGYAYLPGELFPVNAPAVRAVPNLFCVNERLVTYLRTPSAGRVALVAVGATCVGRVRASYDEVRTRTGLGRASHRYPEPIAVEKGAELAMFEMGSTIVLLFEPGKVSLDPRLAEGVRVRMGEALGEVTRG